MLQTFKEKNRENFPNELLEKLSMKDLFKPSYLTSLMQNYPNQEQKYFNKMNPNLGLNINYLSVPHPYSQPDLYNLGHYYQNMNFTQNTIPMDQINLPRNNNNIPLPVISTFPHINSDVNLKNIPSLLNQGKSHKLFSTTNLNNTLIQHNASNNEIGSDFMSRKRKRFIKNNKLVFVQADSAAAKKLEMEGAIECKDEDLTKLDNLNEMSDGGGLEMTSMEESLAKGRKPRGSRYRGVSRNGNQWQVLIMVNKKKDMLEVIVMKKKLLELMIKSLYKIMGLKLKLNLIILKKKSKKF